MRKTVAMAILQMAVALWPDGGSNGHRLKTLKDENRRRKKLLAEIHGR